MFATLGMLRYGTRSIASVRDLQATKDQLFWELFFTQLLTAGFALALYLVYLFLFGDSLSAIWILYILSTALDVTWLFRGEEDFKITVVRNSVIKCLTAFCIFVFIKGRDDVWLYVAIMSLGYFISQVLLWPYVKKHIASFHIPKFCKLIRHLKPSVILFVPLIATSVYRVLDKILIGLLSSSAQLGFFDCADKIIMVPLGVISALGAVVLPRMSYLISTGEERKGVKFIRSTMSFSMIIVICLMFGLIATGDLFAVVYFGDNYTETGYLLVVMSVTVPMIAWASVIREQYLIPKRLDKQYISSVAVGAVFNIMLNLWAIPRWNARGAALVTIATELLVCVMLTASARKYLDIKQYVSDSLPYLGIGVLMCISVKVLARVLSIGKVSPPLLLVLEIIFGLIVFGALLAVLARHSTSHRAIIGSLIKK